MTTTRDYRAGVLALLLNHICQVYSDETDDWASMHALGIAIAAIEADDNMMNERSAETILDNMSGLAAWMLGRWEFPPAIRARLETIRDTHPDYAERKIVRWSS